MDSLFCTIDIPNGFFLCTIYAIPVGCLWTVYTAHIIAPMGYSYSQFMPITSFSYLDIFPWELYRDRFPKRKASLVRVALPYQTEPKSMQNTYQQRRQPG